MLLMIVNDGLIRTKLMLLLCKWICIRAMVVIQRLVLYVRIALFSLLYRALVYAVVIHEGRYIYFRLGILAFTNLAIFSTLCMLLPAS